MMPDHDINICTRVPLNANEPPGRSRIANASLLRMTGGESSLTITRGSSQMEGRCVVVHPSRDRHSVGKFSAVASALVVSMAIGSLSWAGPAAGVSADEVRQTAKEAYIYGFPMVDSYRVQHTYFVNTEGPEYKAAWNQISNVPRVFTPEDKAVVSPNSDTPYSTAGLLLRSEPVVLTVPQIEMERYFSVQLIDAFTYSFDYIGSRTTGNGGGNYLVAGPGWTGNTPPGITKVFRSETDLVIAVYRTQLFEPADIENVKQIQSGYNVQPLSQFLGQSAPASEGIAFIDPLTSDEQKTSLEFFNVMSFALGFAPTHPSETELRARFSRIGVGAGESIEFESLSPELRQAFSDGIADAWTEFDNFEKSELATGNVTSGDILGTREYLKNNYLYRFAAAVVGLYGNSKLEAMYPFYRVDDKGEPLDGSKHRYVIRFAPGQLPPANAFWSLTMYGMPESLLVANPIDRYLINSPMLPDMKLDEDGGLTIYIQSDSPGQELETNWLPSKSGPFWTSMRIYWPKEAALNGSWVEPPLIQVE